MAWSTPGRSTKCFICATNGHVAAPEPVAVAAMAAEAGDVGLEAEDADLEIDPAAIAELLHESVLSTEGTGEVETIVATFEASNGSVESGATIDAIMDAVAASAIVAEEPAVPMAEPVAPAEPTPAAAAAPHAKRKPASKKKTHAKKSAHAKKAKTKTAHKPAARAVAKKATKKKAAKKGTPRNTRRKRRPSRRRRSRSKRR